MEQKKLLRNSQNLRKSMTKEERHLWYDFLKGYPVQFKRQYVIGSYIVDFYCYQAKLIIELDGGQHYEQNAIRYDQIRTEYLEKHGFSVMRFSNTDVKEQFRAVCEMIDTAVRSRLTG